MRDASVRKRLEYGGGAPVFARLSWRRSVGGHAEGLDGDTGRRAPATHCLPAIFKEFYGMIQHRPLATLSGMNTDWLTAKYHFGLGSYGNPDHREVGSLYVWNDDSIAPHSGFPLHGHTNVEIITYVREGVLTHADGLGNRGEIRAGDVQVMSAGTGIQHSERNEEAERARIFQIWLKPRQSGGRPQWATRRFPRDGGTGRLTPLASGRSLAGALPIRADADVYGAILAAGEEVRIALAAGDGAYVAPTIGMMVVNGVRIEAGDGLALTDEAELSLRALSDAEVVIVAAGA